MSATYTISQTTEAEFHYETTVLSYYMIVKHVTAALLFSEEKAVHSIPRETCALLSTRIGVLKILRSVTQLNNHCTGPHKEFMMFSEVNKLQY